MADREGVDWRPVASLSVLQARARLLRATRDFFGQAGVMEVETPICAAAAVSDPAIDSLRTLFTGPGAAGGLTLYLQSSPEFAMKRLLAAASGPIYQICKVFRDGEAGRLHNPEFSLLEWYRPGFTLHQLMAEMEALLQVMLPGIAAAEWISYRDLFLRHVAIDPHRATDAELRQVAESRGIAGLERLQLVDRDQWLDLLLTHLVEPAMGSGPCFVYHYPVSQASLARVMDSDPPVAERFELYLDGIELANGFHELADAAEQRQRFEQELQQRRQQGRAAPPLDLRLLAALQSGLPDCSGVALGLDRLLMHLVGVDHIDQVLSFPLARA